MLAVRIISWVTWLAAMVAAVNAVQSLGDDHPAAAFSHFVGMISLLMTATLGMWIDRKMTRHRAGRPWFPPEQD
jgi:hypothetical protein